MSRRNTGAGPRPGSADTKARRPRATGRGRTYAVRPRPIEAGPGSRAAPARPPVLGIGIDLVENARMAEVLRRWGPRFTRRVFADDERRYCESKAVPAWHYAGRFAVKEAVTKAFGTGIGPHLNWLDIRVTRNERTGEPAVALSGRGRALAEARGVARVLVSLSHTDGHAVAQAMLLAGSAEA